MQLASELFCELCDRQQRLCLCNWKDGLFRYRDSQKEGLFVTGKKEAVNTLTGTSDPVITRVHFSFWVSTKERSKSRQWSVSRNKICE